MPRLTPSQIQSAIPSITELASPIYGGQKTVYPCIIKNIKYALKVLYVDQSDNADVGSFSRSDNLSVDVNQVIARAKREVDILRRCRSPYLAKLGPIPFISKTIAGQKIVAYTEEWIEGNDLKVILKEGALPLEEVVKLGREMALGIEELWSFNIVHRDIKPGNIIRRAGSTSFVLLDLGLAFDTEEHSLTKFGMVPGTKLYLSPDQLDYSKKRALDFRSDLFSLGIVLYESATGRHPFASEGMETADVMAAAMSISPNRPSMYRTEIPEEIDRIILRLLQKKPHLRYRTCQQLVEVFDKISF